MVSSFAVPQTFAVASAPPPRLLRRAVRVTPSSNHSQRCLTPAGAANWTALHTSAPGRHSGFNRVFLRRLRHLLSVGFGGWCSPLARRFWLLLVLIVLNQAGNRECPAAPRAHPTRTSPHALAHAVVTFVVSASFMQAVLKQDASKIWSVFAIGGSLTLIVSALGLWQGYLAEKLRLDLRKQLQENLHERLFSGRLMYWLNCVDKTVDSSDQRLTQDVDMFTRQTAQLLVGSFDSRASFPGVIVGTLLSVAFVLNTVDALDVLASLVYFVVALVVASLLNVPVARATYRVNEAEGIFRFVHSRLREFSEAVTFLGGQERERKAGEAAFGSLYKSNRALFRRQFFAELFAKFQNNLTSVFAAAMVIFVVRRHDGHLPDGSPLTVQSLQEAASATASLVQSLAAIPYLYTLVGALAGLTHRVGQMDEALEQLEAAQRVIDRSAHRIKDAPEVTVSELRCTTEDGRVLFDNLTFSVPRGRHLAIMGKSGVGKSSLLRVIAGLWPYDTGSVARPRLMEATRNDAGHECHQHEALFLPQRAYTVQGTLRDNLLYPHVREEQTCSDTDLVAMLSELGLAHLLLRPGGLDAVAAWSDTLSGGEQQLLAIGRLLYHKPAYAFCDEATSALDPALQRRCMELICDAGITLLSVVHRPALVAYHHDVLELDGDGGATLYGAEEYASLRGIAPVVDGEAAREGSVGAAAASALHHSDSRAIDRRSASSSVVRERFSTSNSGNPSAVDQRSIGSAYGIAQVDGADNSDVKFDSKLRRRLWKLFKLGFPGVRSKPFGVLMLSVLGNLLAAVVATAMSFVPGPVYEAIRELDYPRAWGFALLATGLTATGAAVGAVTSWLGKLLSMYWYRELVTKMQLRYVNGKVLYAANHIHAGLDNCGQRVVEDTRLLTTSFGNVVYGNALTGSFMMACFNVILHTAAVWRFGWIPLTVAYGFALLSMVISHVLMKPIVAATFKANRAEGSFRWAHARAREFAESIAFYKGVDRERVTAERRFDTAYKLQLKLIRTRMPVFFFTSFWTMSADIAQFMILGMIIVSSGQVFGYPLNLGSLMTLLQLSSGLIAHLSSLPTYWSQTATVAGYAHRVGQMLDATAELQEMYQRFETDHRHIDGDHIRAWKVGCRTPTGEVLFKNLTLTVPRGRWMLITGPSGSGKSSLLRVLAGLWPVESGSITRPGVTGRGGVHVMPQVPFVTTGSLRDQLLYPYAGLPKLRTDGTARSDDELANARRTSPPPADDAALVVLLRQLGLSHLLREGLDAVHVWQDMLSLGEQQRLGFCRAIVQRPAYVVMDEATSAMDVDTEAVCLRALKGCGITAISVGHRSTLHAFHDDLIAFDGRGGYSQRALR